MKFIHIADIHLGMIPDKGMAWSEKRAKELWHTFQAVIEQCEKEKIDILLIAGDLFHRQPLKRELLEVSYLFSSLTHTKVVFIAGNHDYIKKDSGYKTIAWSENVTFLGEKQLSYVDIPEINTRVWGFSYWEKEILDSDYDDIDKNIIVKDRYNILLAHGGDKTHIPINYNRVVAKGFDYVALGHIHKPYLFAKETGVVASKIAYAGSLEPLNITETGKHGYIKGSIDENGTRISFIPIAKREYISLQVKINEHTTQIAFRNGIKKIIETNGVNNIYRITVVGEKIQGVTWTKDFLDGIGNIIEVVDETKLSLNIDELLEENKDNAIGLFIQKMKEKNHSEKAMEYGLLALLNND